ncbi:MAG: hypothetical protein WC551_11545 [Patescibacteria group bacterium]
MEPKYPIEFISDDECVVNGVHYISSGHARSLTVCDGCALFGNRVLTCFDVDSIRNMRCCASFRNDGMSIVWIPKPTETVVQPEGEKTMSENPGVTVAITPLPLPSGSRVAHLCLTRRTQSRKGGVLSDITRTGYATLIAVPDRLRLGYWVGASFCEPKDTFSKPKGIQRTLERIEAIRSGIPTAYTFFLSRHALTGQREWHDIALSILVLDLLKAPEWCVRALKDHTVEVLSSTHRRLLHAKINNMCERGEKW